MLLETCYTAYYLHKWEVLCNFVKLFAEKKVCGIFGSFDKSVYLCNRKRETNAPHTEASADLGSEKKKEFFERFT